MDVGFSNIVRFNQIFESFGFSIIKIFIKRFFLLRLLVISILVFIIFKEEDVKQEVGKVFQSECIDFDSDSEGEEDQFVLNGIVFKRENEEEDVIEEISFEEDEFFLFK